MQCLIKVVKLCRRSVAIADMLDSAYALASTCVLASDNSCRDKSLNVSLFSPLSNYLLQKHKAKIVPKTSASPALSKHKVYTAEIQFNTFATRW